MVQNIQKPVCTKESPTIDNSNQGTDAMKPVPFYKHPQCFCPEDWIGFRKNCYFFSKEERDWNSSRSSCTHEHALLIIIDSMKEMDFLMRHKGSSDHWIGLTMTGNQMGKWVNGAMFIKWFNVSGNEECAYLNDGGVASARCYTERKWICRKTMHYLG
ncbi:C-type lectin domain family 2 member B isoform X2 [Choloepus didactylus]|uniref:C-type lectin domain family 2 member B isoform X2 n=1 Tax=Choloepus didactylus TaxID=27675 RepID=UPI0018A0417B|nr:C-type lectin domain family 2 member B isoform X2 [Choloepus didactylus]